MFSSLITVLLVLVFIPRLSNVFRSHQVSHDADTILFKYARGLGFRDEDGFTVLTDLLHVEIPDSCYASRFELYYFYFWKELEQNIRESFPIQLFLSCGWFEVQLANITNTTDFVLDTFELDTPIHPTAAQVFCSKNGYAAPCTNRCQVRARMQNVPKEGAFKLEVKITPIFSKYDLLPRCWW